MNDTVEIQGFQSSAGHAGIMRPSKAAIWIVAAVSMLIVGCVSTVPLVAVPEAKPAGIVVECRASTNTAVVFSTARGASARRSSMNSGLIGILIGSMIGSGEEAQGRDFLKTKIGIAESRECRLVKQALEERLNRIELLANAESDENKLLLRVEQIGLRETQKSFWSPFLQVKARLEKGEKSVWQTTVLSTASKIRSLNEFADRPELFQADLEEVIQDIARQLVEGPIRR